MLRTLFAITPVLILMAAPAMGQMKDNQDKSLTCDKSNHWNNRLTNFCEVREQTLAAPNGAIQIDPGMNGGISVKGWSRPDMLVRARVDAAGASDSDARGLASQIRFSNGGGLLKAEGPEMDRDHNWSVTYEVFVPHQADLDMHAHNGGISIQDVKGSIRFDALNGGVHLARLAGDVAGHTTNGGLHIDLIGDHWDGKGMDVNTANGGVHMSLPANYSAQVETETVNGGMHVDFPVTVSGKINKRLAFTLGNGGPTIRAVTTNGGVTIGKS